MRKNEDQLFAQYEMVREEVQKSIFVQYEVIRTGALILGSLLVFVPAIHASLGGGKRVLVLALVCLAFVSVSFIFIMAAGEIRIIRAAGFSNRLLGSLALRDEAMEDPGLLWDNYVRVWNEALEGNGRGWVYRERTYLAAPFVVITALADAGALITALLEMRAIGAESLILSIFAILAQVIMLWFVLGRLSRDLDRATLATKESLDSLLERGQTDV